MYRCFNYSEMRLTTALSAYSIRPKDQKKSRPGVQNNQKHTSNVKCCSECNPVHTRQPSSNFQTYNSRFDIRRRNVRNEFSITAGTEYREGRITIHAFPDQERKGREPEYQGDCLDGSGYVLGVYTHRIGRLEN
jgi:hypothetical protein